MKTPVLMLTLLLPLAACSSESGPAGSYNLDTAALVDDVKTKMEEGMAGQDSADSAMVKGMLQPMLDMLSKMKVSMDVKADGTFTIHSDNPDGSHNHVSGTWTRDGDKLTMKGKDEESGEEETKELVMKGGNLVMTEKQGGVEMQMVFVRQ